MIGGRFHRPDPAAARAHRLADLLRLAAESGDRHTARWQGCWMVLFLTGSNRTVDPDGTLCRR
jgi:hypothetical protein